jgi:hypothetical protein
MIKAEEVILDVKNAIEAVDLAKKNNVNYLIRICQHKDCLLPNREFVSIIARKKFCSILCKNQSTYKDSLAKSKSLSTTGVFIEEFSFNPFDQKPKTSDGLCRFIKTYNNTSIRLKNIIDKYGKINLCEIDEKTFKALKSVGGLMWKEFCFLRSEFFKTTNDQLDADAHRIAILLAKYFLTNKGYIIRKENEKDNEVVNESEVVLFLKKLNYKILKEV